MDAIGKAIGDAIGQVLGHPVVAAILGLCAAYLVVVWLATALWAFVDMRRRSASLIAPYGSAAIVILSSPILFPLAVVVHRIVRPATTVADRRLAPIRDAALRAEAEEPRCPDCHLVVDEDWLLCPACRRTLGHRCLRCGRTAGLDWELCAWCGAEFESPVRGALARI